MSTKTAARCRPFLTWGLLGAMLAGSAWAADPKESKTQLDGKAFFRPELYLSTSHVPLDEILPQLPNREAWEAFLGRQLDAAGRPKFHVFIDPRSGAATNLMGPQPLIPGNGVGNRVTLKSLGLRLGREVEAVDSAVVGSAVLAVAKERRALLGIDPAQLGEARAVQVRADLWQVSIPQVVRGVPVRDARLVATLNSGNLVTIGTEAWGHVRIGTLPAIKPAQALEAGFAHADGRAADDVMVREPRLEIIPFAPAEHQDGEAFAGPVGKGYGHRLAWTFVFVRPPEGAQWEVIVDAASGEVLSFQDINHYASEQIRGGVYPLTSTDMCPTNQTCGTMQTNWPMPFANTGLAAPNNFTNSAGVFQHTSGTATTTLSGRFVRMIDSCGAVSESAAGSIALGGIAGQHDCTSGGASLGNTPASRSGFYELNKLIEQARGYLPANTWLQNQLTSNMNLNQTCNAFWNGSTVNFYRSGGGCRNTGELAAVFDHEWGHGMDDNDAAGVLSNSSEGYADIAAIYRLQASCVGHGFFWTSNRGCGQTADGTGFNQNEAQQGAAHCNLDCSGVRDSDWDKHADHTPDTALGFVCTSCLASTGPCGRQVHCAAAPARQAAWDLVTRDLTTAPFNLDSQTAFIVGNKLFYQGSGNIGLWHACTCGASSSGCGTANGYMQWLTADDDNGNLNDGTPHMTAIFNAYNRHGIACATPTPTNSGCGGGPSAAPATITATPGSFQVALSWSAVAGATRYWVFRTEGHAGCNFGKALIAEVTGTTYTDTQVANGRTYYYNVVAAGSSPACYGRASTCVNATPNGAPTPDFSLSCNPATVSAQQGGSGTSNCSVASTNGFASAVTLSCAGLPAGATCAYSPNPVTPPANGNVPSGLTVSVAGSVAAGSYPFTAQGMSGATTRTFNMTLNVTAVPTPNFSITCSPSSLSVAQGASGNSTCTVNSTGGFASAVNLDCDSLPAGVTCGYSPNPVTPPANGSTNSTLTVSVAGTVATGNYNIQARGTSGALVRTFGISLTVTGTGGGDLTAVFDPTLRAPQCSTVGRSCDSGAALLLGRDGRGPEPNQPNTIAATCADGTSGVFHVDESNDRLKVSTTDGSDFAPGKTVRIDATVWAWTTPSADRLDLFVASNANSPTWTLLTTLTPTVAGAQTLSATYTLAPGPLQAVRAQFRYQSSATACSAGGWNDRDDLIFAVNSPSGPPDNTATFDAALQAPRCSASGRSCDSGPALLLGRDGKGPEPNQPNTIADSCADGLSGTFHSDESLDRLKVSTVDGTALAPGKAVRIDATVWAWTTPSADHLDLYFAPNANSPTWTFLTTLTPTAAGAQTLSATYTLPAGTLQAVRGRFRYQGSASSCTTGSFDDHDDLVFATP
jgi:trimeric autotransporter adhesin